MYYKIRELLPDDLKQVFDKMYNIYFSLPHTKEGIRVIPLINTVWALQNDKITEFAVYPEYNEFNQKHCEMTYGHSNYVAFKHVKNCYFDKNKICLH